MEQNQRILLVEDSKLDAMLFERTLQLNGFQGSVKVCQAVSDAIDYIKLTKKDNKLRPHLVVLDMFLNGDYGEELLRFIEEDPELKVQVVVITASKPLIDNGPILAYSNVIELLDKPFKYEDFGHIFNGLESGVV